MVTEIVASLLAVVALAAFCERDAFRITVTVMQTLCNAFGVLPWFGFTYFLTALTVPRVLS